MEVILITPDGVVAPLARATGPEQGMSSGSPVPTASEITGLAFSPDGNRLYFNSQRGAVSGITYEVTGPFRSVVAAAAPQSPATTIAGVATVAAALEPALASRTGTSFPARSAAPPRSIGALVALT